MTNFIGFPNNYIWDSVTILEILIDTYWIIYTIFIFNIFWLNIILLIFQYMNFLANVLSSYSSDVSL